jgi:hypothetical protein
MQITDAKLRRFIRARLARKSDQVRRGVRPPPISQGIRLISWDRS